MFCAPWATASRNHQLRRRIALNQATTGTKDTRKIAPLASPLEVRTQENKWSEETFKPSRCRRARSTLQPPEHHLGCSMRVACSLRPALSLPPRTCPSPLIRPTVGLCRWPSDGQAMARLWPGYGMATPVLRSLLASHGRRQSAQAKCVPSPRSSERSDPFAPCGGGRSACTA